MELFSCPNAAAAATEVVTTSSVTSASLQFLLYPLHVTNSACSPNDKDKK
jgi:hypothetical protein